MSTHCSVGLHRGLFGAAIAVALVLGTRGWGAADEALLPSQAVATTVEVTGVRSAGAAVSGVLVNRSPRLLRDVRLLIRYAWLWKNERHPGEDNPGHTDYYTVPGEVPPNGSVPFTYEPATAFRPRRDGHFTVSVEVVSFTEVGR